MATRRNAVGVAVVGLAALVLAGGCRPSGDSALEPCGQTAGEAELSQELGKLRTLGRGEKQSFRAPLRRGQRLVVEARQRGLDLELQLCGPQGNLLATADTWIGLSDPERIEWVTERSGTHRIVVSGIEDSPAGSYVLHWEPPKAATAQELRAHQTRLRAGQLLRMASQQQGGEAPESFAAGLALLAELGELQARAEGLRQQGIWWSRQPEGRQEAQRSFEAACGLWSEIGNLAGELEASAQLCTLAFENGTPKEADQACSKALELAEQVGDPRALGNALVNSAVVRRRVGEVETAERMLRRALLLARDESLIEAECKCLNRLSTLLGESGRRREAVRVGREAVQACDQTRAQAERVLARTNLGFDLNSSGENQQARRTLREAKELAAELGSPELSGVAALANGDLAASLGRPQEAAKQYEEALAQFSRDGARALQVKALLNLGWLSRFQPGAGRVPTEVSPSYFERANELAASGVGTSTQAAIERARGVELMDRGDPLRAQERFEQAVALYRRGAEGWGEAASLRDWAELDRRHGRRHDARRRLRQAREISSRLENPALVASVIASLARLEAEAGNVREAQQLIREAIAHFELVNASAGDPHSRAAELAFRRSYYRQAVELELAVDCAAGSGGCVERAFAWSERSRARGLLDVLAQRGLDVRAGLSADLLDREEQVRHHHSLIQRQLLDLKRRRRFEPGELQRLEGELGAASRDLEDIGRQLFDESPMLTAVADPKPMAFPEVRERLLQGSDIALLEYVVGAEQTTLFVGLSSGVFTFRLGDTAALQRLVEAVLASLRAGSGAPAEAATSLALYQTLLGPAEQHLGRVEELVVVADEFLLGLPFEGLVTSVSTAARPIYLVERWAVRYAPSATVLAALESGPGNPQGGFVGFADPVYPEAVEPLDGKVQNDNRGSAVPNEERIRLLRLVESQGEVEGIAQLFRDAHLPARLFLRAEASEENVHRAEIRKAAFLHFAAHATAHDLDTSLVGLYLSQGGGAEGSNGILTLHEVSDLKLEADLVALSACRSGLGARVSGEGFVGLAWAFLRAGARSLLASLWEVEDRTTAALMRDFYAEVLADPESGRSRALQQVKRRLISRGESPAAWASFVLIGSSR